MAKIDSVYDFSDKGLVELKSWLEPWFLSRAQPVAAGASGDFPVGSYLISRTIPLADSGINRLMTWAYSLGDVLLDLTDTTHPTVIDAGVYSYAVSLAPTVALATGESAFLQVYVNDSLSGVPAGTGSRTFQTSEATAGSSSSVGLDASFVMYQDAGSNMFADVTSVQSALNVTYQGFCRIQKIG